MKPILIVLCVIAALYFALGQFPGDHPMLREIPIMPCESLPSSSLNDNWQRQHPVESGWRLLSVSVVDSLHAWASGWHDSAAGLVVRTTDGGETWSEVSRTFPLFINDIHFVTRSLGWVVGGSSSLGQPGYVRRTTDSGQSWQTQITTPNVVLRAVFFLDTALGWVVGDSGKILATTNSGVDWYVQASRPRMAFGDIVFLPNGTGWSGGTGVLKTTNFGQQWDSVTNILMNRFFFLNDSLGWAITTYGTFAGFTRKTTDGGRTWTEGPILGSVYPTDVVMISDSLVLSTMWDSRVDPPLDYYPISMRYLTTMLSPIETRARILWGIGFAKTGHGFAVGLDEIVGTIDSGRTWTHKAGSPRSYLMSIDMVDDSVGWVVGQNELIMKTTDGGSNWKTQTPAIAGDLYAVSAIDRDHAFAGGNRAFAGGSIFMSTTDGGRTWSRTIMPGAVTITALSFVDARRGWAATDSYNVLRTTDGGVNWTQQGVPVPLHSIDFVDSSYGWCTGTSGLIYATTNGGLTWNAQAVGQVSLFLSINFVDRSYGWVAGEHLILRTTNGGGQWITSDSTIHAGYRAVHFVNRDTGWAVGGGQMFVGGQGRIVATTNGGETWIVQRPGGNPGERALYSVDAVSSSLVWISGQAGEILHTANGGGITSVRTVHTDSPVRFDLEQNYPNPFNSTTTIRFGIASSGAVSLRVYDILGREVATLVEEQMQPGRFETHFDASRFASGVYLYRLVSNGNTTVRKMLLLR